jgi:integrase
MEAGMNIRQISERLLEQAWANNTRKQDSTVARKFADFCVLTKRVGRLKVAEPGTAAFEEQDRTLMDFIGFLASKGLDHSTCKTYLLSLGRQFLTATGVSQMTKHVRPMLCVAGLERIQGAKMKGARREKQALTAEIFSRGIRGIERVYKNENYARRMRAIVAIGISFMLRISEIIPGEGTGHYIRWGGVKWKEGKIRDKGNKKVEGITITIKSSKKSKVPVERTLAATGRETCVVRLLKEYMDGRIRVPGGEESLFAADYGMSEVSSNDVVKSIRAIASEAGEENADTDFSTKSMRIGGVTTLADKSDIEGHIIQKHGRWSSETWSKVYNRLTKETEARLAEHLSYTRPDAQATRGEARTRV